MNVALIGLFKLSIHSRFVHLHQLPGSGKGPHKPQRFQVDRVASGVSDASFWELLKCPSETEFQYPQSSSKKIEL